MWSGSGGYHDGAVVISPRPWTAYPSSRHSPWSGAGGRPAVDRRTCPGGRRGADRARDRGSPAAAVAAAWVVVRRPAAAAGSPAGRAGGRHLRRAAAADARGRATWHPDRRRRRRRPAVPAQARDADRLLVYFHGGGWVVGSLDSVDSACRFLARRSGVSVLSVGYRLAPEHRFPAAPDDTLTAFRFAVDEREEWEHDPTLIAVGGDSAGGNLAAVVCQDLRTSNESQAAWNVCEQHRTRLCGRDVAPAGRGLPPSPCSGLVFVPRAGLLRDRPSRPRR